MARAKKINDIEAADGPALSLDSPADESGNSQFRRAPAKFWEEVAARDPKSIVCYVYRLWPVIDRGLVGEKRKYIDLVAPPDISEDYIRANHGRGTYRLMLHDSSAGRYGQTVAQTKVEITDPDLEPRLDLRELDLGHDANKSFVMALKRAGRLPLEGSDMAKDEGGAVAAKLTDTLVKLTEKRGDGNGVVETLALVEKVLARQPDPLEQAAKLKQIIGGGDTNAVLLKSLLEQQTRLTELLVNQRGNPGRGGEDDLLDKAEKLLGLADRLGLRLGGGGGGASWVDLVAKALPSLAQAFAAMAARGAVPSASPGMGAAVSPDVAPMIPAPVPGVPAPGAPVSPELAQFEGVLSMFGLSLPRILDVASQAVAAFERGLSGDVFAEALAHFNADGERIYDVLASAGRDTILAALKSSPAWARLAARESEVVAFVDAFIEWGRDTALGPQVGGEGGDE